MKLKKPERAFIGLQRVMRVATVDRLGRPHSVPVCHVLDGDRIYFASDGRAKKVRNIRENSSVALSLDEYSEVWGYLRGVMIQGEARLISAGPEFRKARRLLYDKYPQYESEAPLEEGESVIIEVRPRKLYSWGL